MFSVYIQRPLPNMDKQQIYIQNLYMNVHSVFISNRHNPDTMQMSTNRQMDKEIMFYSYNRTRHSTEKGMNC